MSIQNFRSLYFPFYVNCWNFEHLLYTIFTETGFNYYLTSSCIVHCFLSIGINFYRKNLVFLFSYRGYLFTSDKCVFFSLCLPVIYILFYQSRWSLFSFIVGKLDSLTVFNFYTYYFISVYLSTLLIATTNTFDCQRYQKF